jgi:hypothetical protein
VSIAGLRDAVSAFGAETRAKLSNPAVAGNPEDQLRAPLERLVRDLAALHGMPADAVRLVGETVRTDLGTRPDYAVVVHGALVGFIEVKAPGKGADPRRFTDAHDRAQWQKLKFLPNLLYTDGNGFGLWRNGEPGGTVHLDGDVATAGARLSAPPALLALLSDFLVWSPTPPANPRQLAEVSARLCRLLREEVTEQVRLRNPALTDLATGWRTLLFPEATDEQFADGFAQAVAFGLLVARARGISLATGVENAAHALHQSRSLIGTALRLFVDDPDTRHALKTSLDTLARVLEVVDWPTLSGGQAEAWLYFYEEFLGVYDNALRKRTGSYYTPPEVVAAMVRLVDDALSDPALFGRPAGLASPAVRVADPAVGTGTFLLGVLRRIAATVAADQGPGAVPAAVEAATQRLVGFEMQFGPFAVAQLRLMAEVQDLMGLGGDPARLASNLPAVRLFVTDTLGNPFVEEQQFAGMLRPIAESRRTANLVKRETPITVVIGNPPYKDKAMRMGGWIEEGSDGRPSPLSLWKPPADWRVGQHLHNTKNLYVYFWRWATWKVFGSGHAAVTGEPDRDGDGLICFITAAGFLAGDGFQKMRDDLRRDCSDIWIIDCSPEGHQPDVRSRFFQGVQHPVCIVLAIRTPSADRDRPARVRCRALPRGSREDKFAALDRLALGDDGWVDASDDWRAPFLPQRTTDWSSFYPLDQLFAWASPGVAPHRTWVIAPDERSLRDRWSAFVEENDPARKEELLKPDRDRYLDKKVSVPLGNHVPRSITLRNETSVVIDPIRYGFRSFDRHYVIPDHRLLSQARSVLWDLYSSKQVHLTAPVAVAPRSGPALTFTGDLPDMDHYKGSFGGRVFPLWADREGTRSNVRPALLALLSDRLGRAVTAPEVMAYLAALLAHPAFVARFADDLVRPGLRVPLTADPDLFAEAVAIGREVVWLHTYGERFADPAAGRPAGPPRMAAGTGPVIPAGGAIPGAPHPLPDTMTHDAAARRLHVGDGFVDNVPAAVWAYEVSGKNVLRQWFSYRRRNRAKPLIGDRRPPSPLDRIHPDHWPADYTTDLINLLHVLGRLVALEPRQADLLARVCAGPLVDRATVEAALAGAADAGPERGGDGAQTRLDLD